ncbi:MAG: hypothetical protein IPJ40_24290 [Saprospirales bacterium]|nr:hypothetical protein [Saprospirales bacterium]
MNTLIPPIPQKLPTTCFYIKTMQSPVLYGMGFLLGKGGFKLELFTERITQLDTYDLQFGKTIGATTLGGALHITLF